MIEILSKLIQERDFTKLIGLKEDICFEAKMKNEYNLDDPNKRYELAKDVSSFANSRGGYVVIGLITEPLLEEKTDKVIELDMFQEDFLSLARYEGIIKEYIHPTINDLEIRWTEDLNNHGIGLVYIFIPPQDENKKYFLIKNIIEEGQVIRGIVFGIVERIKSASVPLSIDQLYLRIQKGKSSISERLTSLEDKADTVIELLSKGPQKIPSEKMTERIKIIESIE